MQQFEFESVIMQKEGMNAAYIEFPHDVQEVFGVRGRVPVIAQFDNHVRYQGSMVKMKTECHIIGLTQAVRKELGKGPGDKVHVTIARDTSLRKVEVPSAITKLLKDHPHAKSIFDQLSYTHQKEYVRWIVEAKKPETKDKRMAKMVEMLSNNIKHP